MPDKTSIYALNKKDPEAIVYTDADRRVIRLTRADFNTEEDFIKWKSWSDENYHDEEKRDHVEDNHTTPFSEWLEPVSTSDGPETFIERKTERKQRERFTAETVMRVKDKLTEKQFRRLWLYCVCGLTQQQIADVEKVGQRRVSTSIAAAIRKIHKFFSAEGKK